MWPSTWTILRPSIVCAWVSWIPIHCPRKDSLPSWKTAHVYWEPALRQPWKEVCPMLSHCGVGTVINPWSLRLTQRLNVCPMTTRQWKETLRAKAGVPWHSSFSTVGHWALIFMVFRGPEILCVRLPWSLWELGRIQSTDWLTGRLNTGRRGL